MRINLNNFWIPAEDRSAMPTIDTSTGSGSQLKQLPSLFRSLAVLLSTFFLLFSPSLALCAGLVEDFSYRNGPLTTVSAGQWEKFPGAFVGDASVSSGEAVVGTDDDVIRLFPAVLEAQGTTAVFSFSVNIGSGIYNEAGYVISLQPASLPFSPSTINYANSFGVGFLGTAPFLQSSATADVFVLEGGQQVPIGDLTTDIWHTFDISFARGLRGTSYSLALDGSELRTGTFNMSDPRAINSIEMNFATNGIPPSNGYARFDDISIGLPGDFDLDGDVDGSDFLTWQLDPSVGSLSDWQANYGTASSLADTQAVPEPSGTLLVSMYAIAVSCRRRSASSPTRVCIQALLEKS